MVGSKGIGKASVSKTNPNNLAVACADPESLKRGIEESFHNLLDGEEQNNEILNEGSNSTCVEMGDDIVCEPGVGNGCEEETLANKRNSEAKEINFDKAEVVSLCGQTVVVSEEVSAESGAASNMDVRQYEERINEGVGTNGGEEQNSSEASVRGNVNIDEGLCASEYGVVEKSLTDNVQGEEANKFNAEVPVGTPTNNEKMECADQDANMPSNVKSVPEKVKRPKKKVLKKKVVKRKIVLRGEAKLQSLIKNEASGDADKADTNDALKNDEKALLEDQSEAGEERKGSDNMNIDEGLCASEHVVVEEKLLDNLQNEEANKVNAEEPICSHADDGKIECISEDASIANEAKSVPEKILRPKKVLKKNVVKEKMVVQDDVGSMEEDTLGALIEDKASGEMDKEDTLMDLNNEEKEVFDDHGKIELTGEDASTAGNVKVGPGKANGPRKKVLRKKVVRKVVAVAPENEAQPEGSINHDESGEADKVDTNKDAKNGEKVELKPAVSPERETIVRKMVLKGQTSVATANEVKQEGPIDRDASGEADTNKDVKNDENVEIKPAVRAKRKRVRNRQRKGQTNVATASGEQNPKVTNGEAGSKKDEQTVGQDLKTGEAVASGAGVNRSKKKKMKMVKEDTQNGVADGNNNPGPSENRKKSGKSNSMGMIFMCNSETKKDCYRYKVLGLPAGKRDTVLKIYQGMKLFLFDIDRRVMYGIYEASAPGGYNIEPTAFRRQFPSQVRFTVLRDCLPLAEEKFKTAINDNYYAKKKFSCQLTDEQVENLSKLFTETSKTAESKPAARNPTTQNPTAPSSSSLRDKKRNRAEDTRKSGRKGRGAEDTSKSSRNDRRKRSGGTDSRISSAELERNKRRHAHEEVRHLAPIFIGHRRQHVHEDVRHLAPVFIDDRRRHAQEEVRYPAHIVIEDRYHHHHQRPVYDNYERESYLEPPTLPTTVYPGSSREWERPLGNADRHDYEGASSRMEDIYRTRNSRVLAHRQIDLPISSREWERPVAANVPYSETRAYREPPPYGSIQLRPRDADDETTTISVRPSEYFRVSDSYRAPGLPPYRRY